MGLRKLLSNKKGDKFISIYWFVILFIVAGVIVFMVLSFYGKPYDVREVEANTLVERASDCFFYTDGKFNENVLEDGFSFENCGILFGAGDFETGQIYLRADFFYLDENVKDLKGEFVKSVGGGNSDLSECSSKLDKRPFCVEKEFYFYYEEGYVVDVFASVRKTEKNV